MSNPFFFVAHTDRSSVDHLRTALANQYGEQFRIVGTSDPASGRDMLDHLPGRVALVVGDSDSLTELRDHRTLTQSKVVVACTLNDVEMIQSRLTELDGHGVVVLPFEDGALFDAVDDLVNDWRAMHVAGESIVVIGHRWAREAHDLKDFLGRNHLPFRWVDLDRGDEGRRLLASASLDSPQLPTLLLPGSVVLEAPSVEDLAEALSMHHHAERRFYDLVIVGGGPAGLAAAVYGASEGLTTVLIERDAAGGQAGTSSKIENYLGFPNGVSGAELAERALTQARRFGAEILVPQTVTRLRLDGRFKVLTLGDGFELSGAAIVVATGVTYRQMNADGMAQLTGAGVFYGAATSEALDAAGEHVVVVGSANSAGQGALYFAKFASAVTMIVKGTDLRANMSSYLADQIEASEAIELKLGCHVAIAHGSEALEAVTIESSNGRTRLDTRFMFVFIGAEPSNDWLGDLVATDTRGYLYTGPDAHTASWPLEREPMHLECSVPGIFAAGDVRHGSIMRVAGGVGEGSTAVQLVHRYLASVH